jgi:hypothetical protein
MGMGEEINKLIDDSKKPKKLELKALAKQQFSQKFQDMWKKTLSVPPL